MRIVGLARGQHVHFLVQPVGAVFALQLGAEVLIDLDQMGDVGQRVVELLVGQRPVAPVGEARRLVEPRAGDALHELVVGNAVAEAADHRRDLRVEHRMRNQIAEMDDDFDVLPGGMEDLDHRLVGHQPEEGRQVDVRRQRIDQRRHAGRGHLDQAQDRPEGRFADEFGVDGDEIRLFESGENGLEFFLGGDDVHQIAFGRSKVFLDFSREALSSSFGAFIMSFPGHRNRHSAWPAAQKRSRCATAR